VRMTRNLQLRGLGACTQKDYLRAVRQLAAFYRPTPNQFNEEQLREHFLRLKNHSKYSKSVRCPFSRSNGGVFVSCQKFGRLKLRDPSVSMFYASQDVSVLAAPRRRI